jgi:asparagine synthase (glutamine-hydrolysing)
VDEAGEQIREALRESVRYHLVADVPVSAFLSGGIDSGALVGLMAEAGHSPIQAVTLRFQEFQGCSNDEAPLAAIVARHYGVQHHVRMVGQSEFEKDLDSILVAMDQPTIDGINTWFVSKATAELGLKVAISGLGGDELLGGYASFVEIPKIVAGIGWIPFGRVLGKGLRRVARPMLAPLSSVHPKFVGLAEYGGDYSGAYLLKRGLFMPWELPELLGADTAREGMERLGLLDALRQVTDEDISPFAKVATLESAQYMRNQLLRDTDWASMAHSLEVRVPLVDHTLLGQVAALLLKVGLPPKMVLARAPRQPLPPAVLAHRKTGFTTPIEKWLFESRRLDRWNRVKSLRRKGTPWARRLAYSLLDGDWGTQGL